MTRQIVVQIATMSGSRYLVELERAPNVPEFGNVEFFECDPAALPPWDAPNAVRDYGKALMTKLLGAHPLVKKAVEYALELDPADDCPIFIHLKNCLDAERLCWETLCDDKGRFLALDKRWQVARMADAPRLVPKDPVEFRLPLKVMGILSATGVDAAPEWEAFYKAVQGARNAGLPICVDAVIGDEPVFDKVKAIQGDHQLTCTPLTNQNDIFTRIDNFGPNIVHFFCHGSAEYGVPRLELANFNDAASHSSVHLMVEDLLTNAGMRDAWLVTLNCCEGGAATREVHSLAYSLVSKGVYAAVGMLEPVNALDAHEFCTYFYPAIFRRLKKIAQSVQTGSGEPLDWVNALYEPRVALRDRHSDPNLDRQWSLPVLIVQPQPLRVRGPVAAAGVPPSQDEKRAHEETIEGLLATIPPEKMQEFRDTLIEIRAGA
jgi:hypothetical protein